VANEQLDDAIERYHAAALAFVNGNPEPQKAAFSHADGVTLVNPAGFVGRGWAEAEKVMEGASSRFTDGEVVGFNRIAQQVTAELAYIVEVERCRARVSGSDEIAPIDIRVTTIFRIEDGAWKVVHRHADPLTSHPPSA
jgi:ketosteroid isomerase-like protein